MRDAAGPAIELPEAQRALRVLQRGRVAAHDRLLAQQVGDGQGQCLALHPWFGLIATRAEVGAPRVGLSLPNA
ncbi:unnamed protein product [Brugia timori]|uniref:Uncharacterized protein n=1 Tax=Brugia timori TaxID=42155 RepID=A0A3P7T0X1_9BILA|nr:unnamed protein product [Brugia timori]